MKILHIFLTIPIFFTLSFESFSQPEKSERSGGFFYNLSANFENSLDSDLDSGGGFSFYRFGVNGSIGKSVTERTSVELGMDYNHDSFDFTGTSGFGRLDPWEDINRAGIGLSVKHRANSK